MSQKKEFGAQTCTFLLHLAELPEQCLLTSYTTEDADGAKNLIGLAYLRAVPKTTQIVLKTHNRNGRERARVCLVIGKTCRLPHPHWTYRR